MVFDSLRRAMGGEERRLDEVEAELRKTQDALEVRAAQLEDRQASRQKALFPEGPVAGGGEAAGRYPGLHSLTFEEGEPQTWLVAAATGIIDKFPGSETLLSQLDATFLAFAEANHLRVRSEGPYSRLHELQSEILACWDLDLEVPLYVSKGGRSEVLGCKTPFVVVDRYKLDELNDQQQRFLLATLLGHVFFGNLKIFAFYRLFEMLDKLPSMTSLITRGLGMIPTIGNTISRGIELARSLNQQVIRKTNLVVGQRQHVLCDRLATLCFPDQEIAQGYLALAALGGGYAEDGQLRAQLIEQGREVQERFERREVDLAMLSIVAPQAPFAAWRAYKLDSWFRSERAQRLREGYYVTQARLDEYRRSNQALEEEISSIEARIVELHERQDKLLEERQRLLAELEEPDES
ncbi:MAG TPA: hypothetical protein DEA08_09910 [Planctomycetes bacterium]|nr:hypothetical protein [Planctomycetota bacterium]